MSIVPIIQLDKDHWQDQQTNLRQPTGVVNVFDGSLQTIIDNLIDTLKSSSIAIGLAAPQIGIQLRVAVINLSPNKQGPTIVLINPRIDSTSGKKDKKKESCMSVPHFRGEVERRSKVTITYQDRAGISQSDSFEGFAARVVCHEIDHLDGVLYIDRVSDFETMEAVDFFRD